MLRASNIYKRFGDTQVLRGVSVQVSRGEVVAIIEAALPCCTRLTAR